jgi:hypothetical protein
MKQSVGMKHVFFFFCKSADGRKKFIAKVERVVKFGLGLDWAWTGGLDGWLGRVAWSGGLIG